MPMKITCHTDDESPFPAWGDYFMQRLPNTILLGFFIGILVLGQIVRCSRVPVEAIATIRTPSASYEVSISESLPTLGPLDTPGAVSHPDQYAEVLAEAPSIPPSTHR